MKEALQRAGECSLLIAKPAYNLAWVMVPRWVALPTAPLQLLVTHNRESCTYAARAEFSIARLQSASIKGQCNAGAQ